MRETLSVKNYITNRVLVCQIIFYPQSTRLRIADPSLYLKFRRFAYTAGIRAWILSDKSKNKEQNVKATF